MRCQSVKAGFILKVLQINVSNEGSTGNIADSLHKRLVRDGDESVVLCGRGSNKHVVVQSTPELYANALLSRISGRIGCFGKKSTDRILAQIREFSPDVVHLHNVHGYYVDIFRLLSFLKKNKIRTVVTLHDEFLFTGKCAFSGTCQKWRVGCGNCRQLREYPAAYADKSDELWHLKKQVFSDFEYLTLVSPSQWLADRVKESFLSEHMLHVIPNGIETDVFRPGGSTVKEALHIAEERVVLAAAQNIMSRRKGGKFVLELAEKMSETRFLVVGADSNSQQMPNVTFIRGRQSAENMANLYRGSDVFLITSREDNFPTVCLEAAACGTAVAGFKSGGIPETVLPEFSRFVSYGDVEALKSAVNELLAENDKKFLKTFAHTAENMYKHYKNEIYEAIR